jgi:hypothetical protein
MTYRSLKAQLPNNLELISPLFAAAGVTTRGKE